MSRRILVVVALAALAPSSAARLQTRKVELAHDGKRLLLGVKLTDLLDGAQRDRLQKGFSTRIRFRVELRREGGGRPVATARFERRGWYDLWEEKFVVVRDRRLLRFARTEVGQAMAGLTELKRVAIAPLAEIAKGQRHFLRVRVALNPVSEWLRLRMKGWLEGGCRDRIPRRMGGGHSTFVAGVCDTAKRRAERVLEFRSQAFTLRDVKRR